MQAGGISRFDAADYLDSDEAIAAYLQACIDENNPDLIIAALGDIARAKGMTQLAKDTGLSRESLYKALTPGAKPRFDTIWRVISAMHIHFTAGIGRTAGV